MTHRGRSQRVRTGPEGVGEDATGSVGGSQRGRTDQNTQPTTHSDNRYLSGVWITLRPLVISVQSIPCFGTHVRTGV